MRCTIGPSRRPAHGHGSAAHRDDSGLFNKGAAKPNPPKDMNLEQVIPASVFRRRTLEFRLALFLITNFNKKDTNYCMFLEFYLYSL